MEGRPVWLASISIWHKAHIVPTGIWTKDALALQAGLSVLQEELLRGVGDPSRERLFRMNITMCLHRGMTDAEERRIGPGQAVHLAGGPVEILWEKGVRGSAAAQPCEDPIKELLPNAFDHGQWLPVDCGRCAPCVARLAIEEEIGSRE